MFDWFMLVVRSVVVFYALRFASRLVKHATTDPSDEMRCSKRSPQLAPCFVYQFQL